MKMEKRLLSLKLPRDLTLGGTKQQKKTYVPNLNVVRNKAKAQDVVIKQAHKAKDKLNDKKFNRKPNEVNGKYIQAASVFSEGGGGEGRKSFYHDRSGVKDDAPSLMTVPTIKKEITQIDQHTETSVFNQITVDEDDSDDDQKRYFGPVDWVNNKSFKTSNSTLKAKEILYEENLAKLKLENESLADNFKDSSALSDYNPLLTLWHLPNSFACKQFNEEGRMVSSDFKLSDMLEGQIGKVQIRKSGKVEILIGCVRYDLNTSDMSSSTEEIVEINISDNNQQNQSTVLGKIQGKYVLEPNFDNLIKQS